MLKTNTTVVRRGFRLTDLWSIKLPIDVILKLKILSLVSKRNQTRGKNTKYLTKYISKKVSNPYQRLILFFDAPHQIYMFQRVKTNSAKFHLKNQVPLEAPTKEGTTDCYCLSLNIFSLESNHSQIYHLYLPLVL